MLSVFYSIPIHSLICSIYLFICDRMGKITPYSSFQEEERQAAEEAAEVTRLRQEAVHKANPVPKFKPVTLQLPHHPVTIPKSPRFATESRLRSRSCVNSTFDISSATYTAE